MTLDRIAHRGNVRALAAAALFAAATLVPHSAAAISDKWTGVMSGGHVRDVHVFVRDGVGWGLIIDDGVLTGGTHEHVGANGGDSGGVNIANASAASLALSFADGGGTTVPAGETLFLPGDPTFEYSLDYGAAQPGAQDTVRFQEIAAPFEQQGVQYDGIVNYELLLDLGGATLGQPATQSSLRMGDELTPTPLTGAGLFSLDPLDVSGKFMLIPVPEPTTLAIACGLLFTASARRRR